MAVELRVLGSPDLRDRSGNSLDAVLVQPKRFALLVFLTLSRPSGFHRRDELLALFWPDQPEESARNALNQALWFLRRSLGSQLLPSRGHDEVGVDRALLSCDALGFLDAADRGDEEAVLAAYAGDLLPAFHLEDAPAFGDWLEQERRLLRNRAVGSAKVLSARAEANGHFASAVDWATRGMVLAPCDETVVRQLVLLQARLGNLARAVQAYDDYVARIREELDVDASPDLSALVADIRSQAAAGGPAPARGVDLGAGGDSRQPRARATCPGSRSAIAPVLHAANDGQSPKPVSVASRKPPTRWRTWTTILGVAAMVVVGGALVERRPADRAREFVVVADFETPPADSGIADLLTDETRRALSESRSLGAAPDSRVAAARRRLQLPSEDRLTTRLARQVALGAGIGTVVAGSLRHFGGGYALSLRLISAPSGEVLATAAGTGVDQKELIVALDSLTRTLRARFGEDLELIRAQPPLMALTSTSLEAMSYYVAARRAPMDSATKLLRAAVALDTSFAAAHWQLAIHYTKLVTDDERRALLARAYAHRAGLTEYERLRVESEYLYGLFGVTPSRARLIERLRQIVEKYPNYDDASALAGWYLARRDLAAAESTLTLAIALDPNGLGARVGLVDVLLERNQIPAARKAVDALMRQIPGSEIYEATTAYAEGRRSRVREILQEAKVRGTVWPGGELYLNVEWLNLLEGRVSDWERDYPPSIPRDSAESRLLMVMANYWVRNRPAEGLRMLEAELAAHPEQRRNPDAAVLFAQFNRPDLARSVLAACDSAGTAAVQQGFGQNGYRRTVTGWVRLAEGKPLDAVTEFRSGQRASDGPADQSVIDVDAEVGLAFERAGRPDSAIVAYEHYLNSPDADRFYHDGLKLAWVLEHVAALHEAQGKREVARAAYQRFADLWSNADPELQFRVRHARQRIAALAH